MGHNRGGRCTIPQIPTTRLPAATVPSEEELSESFAAYAAYHAPRHALVVGLLRELQATESSTILDIGRSGLTALLRSQLHARVDTLGFGPDEVDDRVRHYQFDLNHAQDRERWRQDLPTYDFVLLAEVLEHLYTAPELVLRFLGSLVEDDGILLLQTPNAASLPKRVKLLLGRNPYDRIRPNVTDPGHFREYTIGELVDIATAGGFVVERCLTGFYFDARYGRHLPGRTQVQPIIGRAKNWLYSLLPPTMREGITLVLRKRTKG